MLTVHHLGVSQSERLVWLCEELGIDYTLKIHNRAPVLAPKSIQDLNPVGSAPVIQDGSLTMAESAACVEYIIHKHGNGRFVLPPSHPDYATYLYWFHYANGTLQPGVVRLMTLLFAGVDGDSDFAKRMHGKTDAYLKHMDDHLGLGDEWLAGKDFTAADIMTVFTLTTMRTFYPLDLSAYGNILEYLKRVSQRPAYIKHREKGDAGLELMIDGPPPKSFFEKLKNA